MGEQRTALFLLLILCLIISALPLVRAAEDSWVTKKSMQVARDRLGIAVVNGKIYAIGGDSVNLIGNCIGPGFGTTLNTTEEYNPATDTWTVLVDGNSVTPSVNEDTTNTFLYFTYPHTTKTVEVIGTEAIPEFPSWTSMFPILGALSIVVALFKLRLNRNRRSEKCEFLT